MKRLVAFMLALALAMCLIACDAKDQTSTISQEAFTVSQQAFEKVNEAYMQINVFSEDIYEAWRLGVNNSRYGCSISEFASEMHIERKYIEEATAKLRGSSSFTSTDWTLIDYSFNNSYFSAYVAVISQAYVCSGDVEKITTLLVEAKTLMKQLSNAYSDYEHYPSLKTYFTNTLAFFDFCKYPEGSFEQVVETFNNYRNVARECFFELNYIFSDDIGGLNDKKTEPSESAT